MLSIILGIYSGILLATYVTTLLLVFKNRSCGSLPLLYTKFIEYLQARMSVNSCVDLENNNDGGVVIGRTHLTPAAVKTYGSSPFEISTDLLSNGIASILQDDVTRPFLKSPQRGWWILSMPQGTDPKLLAAYALSVAFRWGILFPLRLALLLSSLGYITCTGIFVNVFSVSQKKTLSYGITFARLYNSAMGIIVRAHDIHNRPKASGIAVANHLTANDVMHIYSNCSEDGVGYTVTGQSHGGVLEVLERFGGKLTPTLWLDREVQKEREMFQKQVIQYASRPDVFPVLLFPEGYCTNNTSVLQFRKAVFTGEVPIYPIAIAQNSRVGDAFWREDTFIPYLLRVMSSWALYYDIYYMPTMEKRPTEDPAAFAGRVQAAIAGKVGCTPLPFDGGLKKPTNRLRFREMVQLAIAQKLGKE